VTEITDWSDVRLGFAGENSAISSTAQNNRFAFPETEPQRIHNRGAVAISEDPDVTLLDPLTDASIEKRVGWHGSVA
jgi:hypothetical protein